MIVQVIDMEACSKASICLAIYPNYDAAIFSIEL